MSEFGSTLYPAPLTGLMMGTGRGLDPKTIRVPSGDQSADWQQVLTRWRLPPSASTTKSDANG